MRRIFSAYLFFSFAFIACAACSGLEMTSYYPAPTGNYSKLRLNPQPAITPNTNCPVGTLYANATDLGRLYYCVKDTPFSKYVLVSGTWVLTGDNLHLADTTNPAAKKVGIGTMMPQFKLTLAGDGGILSRWFTPSWASGTALVTAGAGTRLMWIPSKKAFRSGYAAGNEWDVGNIDPGSVVMGYGSRGMFVLGGENNDARWGMILGGKSNAAKGGIILGGENNVCRDDCWEGGLAGFNNSAGDVWSDIGGGRDNSHPRGSDNYSRFRIIAGGNNNKTYYDYQIISGGGDNSFSPSQVSSYGVISGGRANTFVNVTDRTVIAGGHLNSSSASYSVNSGGKSNVISGQYSVIAGGSDNLVQGLYSVVGGGHRNTVSQDYSVIGAGEDNGVLSPYATVMGGKLNRVEAASDCSMIAGGADNSIVGPYSFVAGRNMRLTTGANNTFLWGYSAAPADISTANAFIIYSGRMGIRDITPAAGLEINGNNSADDYLNFTSNSSSVVGDIFTIKKGGSCNGCIGVNKSNPQYIMDFGNGAYVDASGKFMPSSSREYKENITALDLDQALETLRGLNPVRFNYKLQKDEEYVGFIAEDVPALVVQKQRQGLAPMDIAAVLTKVVAYQQEKIEQQKQKSEDLLNELEQLNRHFE
ncbi:MAG: tail fiber domain-containing protein [Candidatus Omnitrophica bacterium]|nr:tail fiber domain-containing protein [Candidatus Omnitrophota bacterium]